jgi:hypothetical protein
MQFKVNNIYRRQGQLFTGAARPVLLDLDKQPAMRLTSTQ